MASGWARRRRSTSVVVTTVGPGVTNIVSAIAGAFKDSLPLLVITGQHGNSRWGHGRFQESSSINRGFSPTELLAPITKASWEVTDVANAVELFEEALRLTHSGRPGPVHLSIPVDIQTSDVGALFPIMPESLNLSTGAYRDVPVIVPPTLLGAKRPVIIVGWGVYWSEQEDNVASLAEYWGAPIISSIKGRAAVSDSHAWTWGALVPGQVPQVLERLRAYAPDVVLVLGASLAEYYAAELSSYLRTTYVVRVDRSDERYLGQSGNVWIQMDLSQFVPALLKILRFTVESSRSTKHAAPVRLPRTMPTTTMGRCVSTLREYLPEGTVVWADAGNHWLETLYWYETYAPRELFVDSGLACMGSAIGNSIGMAMATPRRHVICITGDGSALMAGSDMSIAAELSLRMIFLIFNNRALGRVRVGQMLEFGGNTHGSAICAVNFADWGAALGLKSKRVANEDELQRALADQFFFAGPSVLEVMVPPEELPTCFLPTQRARQL